MLFWVSISIKFYFCPMEKIKINCADGVQLSAILIAPKNPRAALQFSGGTGFKKEFFLPFAEYLAEKGFATIIFDYRGTGESAPTDMRACEHTFLEYGIMDLPAVMEELDRRYPTLPKLYIGHSVGAQQVGFMHNCHKIKGLVVMMAGSGYGGNMAMAYRLKAFYFFNIFTPLSILFTGYVKAKSLKIMENLPRNVATQWRDWCSKPAYFFDPKFYGKSVPKGHFQDFDFPIHIFRASDDPGATERNINVFWKHIKTSKTIDIQLLTPSDYGLKSINHFGFFKRTNKEKLWHLVIEKLEVFL